MNKIILLGNAGADVILKFLPSGLSVAEFSIATSEQDRDKKWVPIWHRIKAFDKQAELAGDIKKGYKVFVEGKIAYREYEDKAGNKRSITEVIAFTLCFLAKDVQTEDHAPPQKSMKEDVFTELDVPF